MNQALAAWFGVPVVMVSGDDVAVAQGLDVAPHAEGVIVKRAINSRAVELVPLAEARAAIEAGARAGAAARQPGAPERAASYRVEMAYNNVTYPEIATAFQEVELLAPDTIAFTRATMPEAYRLIRVLYRFINPD